MKQSIWVVFAFALACNASRFRARNSSAQLKGEASATKSANVFTGATAQVAKAPAAESSEQMPRKLTMQIPEDEVNEFLNSLSAPCRKIMAANIRGDGADLHTFGKPGVEPTEDSCKNLNGSLCSTLAHIFQETHNSSGRQLSTTVEMKGKSCLPQDCVSSSDLSLLAAFMHSKAKNSGQIPGQGVELNLHVDCTASGGSVVDTPRAEEDKHSTENAHAGEHVGDDKHGHPETKNSVEGHDDSKTHDEAHSPTDDHQDKESVAHEDHDEHADKKDPGAKSGTVTYRGLSILTGVFVLIV